MKNYLVADQRLTLLNIVSCYGVEKIRSFIYQKLFFYITREHFYVKIMLCRKNFSLKRRNIKVADVENIFFSSF